MEEILKKKEKNRRRANAGPSQGGIESHQALNSSRAKAVKENVFSHQKGADYHTYGHRKSA